MQTGKRFPHWKVKFLAELLLPEISTFEKVKVFAILFPLPVPPSKQLPPPVFPPTTIELVPVVKLEGKEASACATLSAPVDEKLQLSPGSPP